MAIARAVKHNDTIFLGSHLDKAARFEILNHAAIAMQQNKRLAPTALDIMQPDAVDLQKVSRRRVVSLGFRGEISVNKGRNGEHSGGGGSHRIGLGLWDHKYLFRESVRTIQRELQNAAPQQGNLGNHISFHAERPKLNPQ